MKQLYITLVLLQIITIVVIAIAFPTQIVFVILKLINIIPWGWIETFMPTFVIILNMALLIWYNQSTHMFDEWLDKFKRK